jgi:hypothetical protein
VGIDLDQPEIEECVEIGAQQQAVGWMIGFRSSVRGNVGGLEHVGYLGSGNRTLRVIGLKQGCPEF